MNTLDLLTWNEVADRWKISPRHARRVARRLGLVPVVLGYRTMRFPMAAVKEVEIRAGLQPATGRAGDGETGAVD